MPPVALKEFLATPYPKDRFAIVPFVPLGGSITLLYGKTRLGKSPLTWEMARCIATGAPFFGYPTLQGKVLYIELDTPPSVLQPRMALINGEAEQFYLEFSGAVNILMPSTQAWLHRLKETVHPLVVIFNTLRKLYQGDEKDGGIPSKVYAILRQIFSPAGIVLIHHDKKTQGRLAAEGLDPAEAFSGHMAWLNDCQVGLHLVPGGPVSGRLTLTNTKNQLAEEAPPLSLFLDANGTNIERYQQVMIEKAFSAFSQLPEGMRKTEKVRLISQSLGVTERTIWTYLSRWTPLKSLRDDHALYIERHLQQQNGAKLE